MIPTGRSYTVTLKGSVLKVVECDECGAEYAYTLQRTAKGYGFSPLFVANSWAKSRASLEANAALNSKLQRAVDVVPCPRCGHVQKHMLSLARMQHMRWMLVLGASLAAVSIAALLLFGLIEDMLATVLPQPIPWPTFLALFGSIGLLGLGFISAQLIIAGLYDPNQEDEESRIRRGRKRARLLTDAEIARAKKTRR